jgi:hypothetical protein
MSRVRSETSIAGVQGGYAALDSGLLIPQDHIPNIPFANLPPVRNYWPTTIIKDDTQVATGATTYQDETDLQFSVTTDSVWDFNYMVLFFADNEEDAKMRIVAPILLGWWRANGSDTTVNNGFVEEAARVESVANTTDMLVGGGSMSLVRTLYIQAMMQFSGNGTVKLQFASNQVQQGNEPSIVIGSRLRARRLV